jgi:tRNA-binding protein
MITIDDFAKVELRVGTVIGAEVNEKARKPAYRLTVDFGEEIGVKVSSAQLTELYTPEVLVGLQVVGVVNFPPRQVAGVRSEALILGCCSRQGTVLLKPAEAVGNGDKVY